MNQDHRIWVQATIIHPLSIFSVDAVVYLRASSRLVMKFFWELIVISMQWIPTTVLTSRLKGLFSINDLALSFEPMIATYRFCRALRIAGSPIEYGRKALLLCFIAVK
jgi:hypothetical protein